MLEIARMQTHYVIITKVRFYYHCFYVDQISKLTD